MTTTVLKLAFLLTVALITAAFACAQPYGDRLPDDVRAFFTPPEGCSAPCWAGIQPGETSVDDAVSILDHHDWVSDVYPSISAVDWVWNGSQPAFVDAGSSRFQGRMTLTEDALISSVAIQTKIESGNLWAALGAPDRQIFMPVVDRRANPPQMALVYMAVYEARGLYIFNFLDCPVTPRDFWFAPNTVSFGAPQLPFEETIEVVGGQLPDWFFRNEPPACGAVTP
jgi:hypothetical protein